MLWWQNQVSMEARHPPHRGGSSAYYQGDLCHFLSPSVDWALWPHLGDELMLDWVWFFTRTLNFSACFVWLDFLGTGFLGLVVVIIQKDLHYSWWNCFVTFRHLILQFAYIFRVMRIGWEEDEESTHNERMGIDQLSLHSRPVTGGGLQKFYLYFKNFASYHHFKTTWGLLLIWINFSLSPMLYKLKETWQHLRKKKKKTNNLNLPVPFYLCPTFWIPIFFFLFYCT